MPQLCVICACYLHEISSQNGTKAVLAHFPDNFKTIKTPSRQPSDNLQELSETLQTTARDLEDTSENLFRHLTVLKYASTGWVGGPHCIIIPLRGPTCKLRTCKNSSELEFQVGPECGKNNKHFVEIFGLCLKIS